MRQEKSDQEEQTKGLCRGTGSRCRTRGAGRLHGPLRVMCAAQEDRIRTGQFVSLTEETSLVA